MLWGERVKLTFCSFILVSSILLCSSSLRLFCSASLSRRAASAIDQYSENRRGEERRGLTYSSRISLVCTAAALPPGVADAVGGGAGVAPVVSPGQRLEVGLHEPLPPAHLVHALHAEGGKESELTTKASRQQ